MTSSWLGDFPGHHACVARPWDTELEGVQGPGAMGAGGLRAAHPPWLTGQCTRPHLGPLHAGCPAGVETLAHFLSPHFPGVGKQPVLGREPAVPPGGPRPLACPTQEGRPAGGSPRSGAESEVPGRNRRFRLLIPLLNAPPTTALSERGAACAQHRRGPEPLNHPPPIPPQERSTFRWGPGL